MHSRESTACRGLATMSSLSVLEMHFNIDVVRNRGMAVLSCRGRLVLGHGTPLLREAAERELSAFESVALDLSFVTQMDASGIGVLAETSRAARHAGRVLVLTGVNDRVLRLLRLTRLDAFIPRLRDVIARPVSDPVAAGQVG